MAKISVVVPTYNRANLLLETLASISRQTLAPDEIIIVDDGSTDDTAEVLKRYGQSLTVIRVKNGGDLVARNIGLRAASGDLVAFCDSDDLWQPGFLAALADLFDREPGMIAAYGNFQILRNGKLSDRTKFDDAPPEFWRHYKPIGADDGIFTQPMIPSLLKFQPFFTSAMMANRLKFLEIGGWDEGSSRLVGGDFATALRIATRPPIGVCKKPLVAIRKHGTNYSSDTEKMNLGDAKVLEYVLASRPEMSDLAPFFRASIDRRRLEALGSAFSRRDFASVREIDRTIKARRSLIRLAKVVISSLPVGMATTLATILSR